MSTRPAWSRIVLKLSGEALAEPSGFGLDSGVLSQVAEEVREAREELGTDIAIVVGGGNFWRGLKGAGQGMDQAQADYMGMLATVMNGLALQDALERAGQHSRVMSAIEMPKIAEPYIRRRAERHLEKGRVVILAGGTGNPFSLLIQQPHCGQLKLTHKSFLRARTLGLMVFTQLTQRLIRQRLVMTVLAIWMSSPRVLKSWIPLLSPSVWIRTCPSSCSTSWLVETSSPFSEVNK